MNISIHKTSKLAVPVLMVIALALTATTVAVLSVNQTFSSNGTITTSPNIGVFSDAACTINKTSINWGSVAAGGNTTQTIYIKNTGTGTMTLTLSAFNWSPTEASTYLTVSWNQQGTQLSTGQSVTATITLTVSPSVNGFTSFSNTIRIIGTA